MTIVGPARQASIGEESDSLHVATTRKPGSRPAFRFHPHVQRVAIGAELETKQVVAPSIRTPKAVASLCLSHLFLKDHKLELHAFFQP
jgi:hypothetical protein